MPNSNVTLIACCITPNHVVQVSDRRMTWLTGPRQNQKADDDQNKAVVVCNRLAIGYTGLGEVQGLRTDEWVLDVAGTVTPYNPQRILEAIAERSTTAFRAIRLPPESRRHAFLVVGWGRLDSREAPLNPFASAVSNALDDEWKWTPEAADKFQVRTAPLGSRPYLLTAIGQPLSRAASRTLNRHLRSYVPRERGPGAYLELLAKAIRETADTNATVGRDLMAVSLPRAALDQSSALSIPLGGPLPGQAAIALYLPDSTEEPIRYTPNYACNGMLIKGGWIRTGPEIS